MGIAQVKYWGHVPLILPELMPTNW